MNFVLNNGKIFNHNENCIHSIMCRGGFNKCSRIHVQYVHTGLKTHAMALNIIKGFIKRKQQTYFYFTHHIHVRLLKDGGPGRVKQPVQADSLLPGSWISDGEFKDAEKRVRGGGGKGEDSRRSKARGEKWRGSKDLQCWIGVKKKRRKKRKKHRMKNVSKSCDFDSNRTI